MALELIDAAAALKASLNGLPERKSSRPSFYIDLEGNKLSREGTFSVVTILVEPRHTVHLIDMTRLQSAAFTTADGAGRTLKSLLEDADATKVFYDVRRDSDALFSHFGVKLLGVEDLQLMDLTARTAAKRYVCGLAKCIELDAHMSYTEKQSWKALKTKVANIFNSPDGYGVFDQRPLSPELQKYCAQDVLFLPALRDTYRAKLCDAWWTRIPGETGVRIALSQSPTFNPKGNMAAGPPAWLTFFPTEAQRQRRTLLTDDAELDDPLPRHGWNYYLQISSQVVPVQFAAKKPVASSSQTPKTSRSKTPTASSQVTIAESKKKAVTASTKKASSASGKKASNASRKTVPAAAKERSPAVSYPSMSSASSH